MAMPMIAGLRAEQWRNLSANERLGALQDLENALAARDGREPATVGSFAGKPNKLGDYDRETNTIRINEALYNPDTGQPAKYGDDNSAVSADEPYMAVETLLHEDRHAYQHYVAEQRPDLAEDTQQLDDFQKNVGPAYIQPQENSLKYACQPTEMDARQAARQEADELYSDDPDYQAHRDHMAAEAQGLAEQAEFQLGSDYEETVRQEVYARHEAALSQSASASDHNAEQGALPIVKEGVDQQSEAGESPSEVVGEVHAEGSHEGGPEATATAAARTADGAGVEATAEASAPTAAQASAKAAGEATEQAAAQSAAEPASDQAASQEGKTDAQAADEGPGESSEGYDYYSGYGY